MLIGDTIVPNNVNEMSVTVEEYSKLQVWVKRAWKSYIAEKRDSTVTVVELRNNLELQNHREKVNNRALNHFFEA